MDQRVDSLLRSFKWLQTSCEYSDLRILCPGHTFHVHKAIICPRSEYFAKACKWGNGDQLKDKIDLEDEDSRLFGLLIDYFYQLDYDDLLFSRSLPDPSEALADPGSISSAKGFEENSAHRPSEETIIASFEPQLIQTSVEPAIDDDAWPSQIFVSKKKDKKKKKKISKKPQLRAQDQDLTTARLVVNAHMYALADKYDIEDLKVLAQAKFEMAVVEDWDTKAFARAAELVFQTTPNSDTGLRAVVVRTINEHIELIDYEEIQALLDSGNGIAWKLVQALVVKPVIWP